MLGVAIAGLLASFMAGMAANVSAFNTVFSYDLWQNYVIKDRSDDYYLRVGRIATVAATLIAIGTALFARNYQNIMNYLQTLFGFFNAPLFATFILGMFWKRMTATAGWAGLVSGTAAAVLVGSPERGRARSHVDRRHRAEGPGRELRGGRRRLRRRHPGQHRGHDVHQTDARSPSCAAWSAPSRRGPTSTTRTRATWRGGRCQQAGRSRPGDGHRPQHHLLVGAAMAESTDEARRHAQGRTLRHADHHRALLGIYGIITLLAGLFTPERPIDRADGPNINVVAGIGMIVTAALLHPLGAAAADRGPRRPGVRRVRTAGPGRLSISAVCSASCPGEKSRSTIGKP